MKEQIRKLLIALHIDATQNLKYDRLTDKIIVGHLKPASNCIDVGCHKGEILERMLHCSPQGHHYAFEPLPDMYQSLQQRFGTKATIYPYALSNVSGDKLTFNCVRNAPAYSGLKQRSYDDLKFADVEQIAVDVRRLDDVIPDDVSIDLIKIDVEGGDYNVLQGAERIVRQYHPLVIFEFGLGGADHYGVKPEDVYHLMVDSYGYRLFTLEGFIKKQPPLTLAALQALYTAGKEYYFVASR